MSSGESDVIQIVESEAELRANERISGGIHLSSHTVRLEAENSSCNVVYIISPTGDDGVSINFFARNSSSG